MVDIDAEIETTGSPDRRTVPSAGFHGVDGRVGHQLDARGKDPVRCGVDDDRAVHLRQLTKRRGGVGHVERKAAGGDVADDAVLSEDDQATGTAAEDALETFAELSTRRHPRDVIQKAAPRVDLVRPHWSSPASTPRSAGLAASYGHRAHALPGFSELALQPAIPLSPPTLALPAGRRWTASAKHNSASGRHGPASHLARWSSGPGRLVSRRGRSLA